MSSLRDIRKRIRAVSDTRQMTRAMKVVSAVKLRRAHDQLLAIRPYATTFDAVMSTLISRSAPGDLAHPLLTRREVRKTELVVVTSDRGFAGAFSVNIGRQALSFVAEQLAADHEVFVSTVGRRGHQYLRTRGVPPRRDHPGLLGRLSYAAADSVAQELCERFLEGTVDAVVLLYNRFVSALALPTQAQLLPFEAGADGPAQSQVEYRFEPARQPVLEQLVRRAMTVQLWRALLESSTAEHAARMTAMAKATHNADEVIGSLRLSYNRGRQAQITRELVEIVSGAEALK